MEISSIAFIPDGNRRYALKAGYNLAKELTKEGITVAYKGEKYCPSTIVDKKQLV